MLLRLSQASFWLAAAAAAVALAVPTGLETLLTGVALVGAALAFGLWRLGVAQVRDSQAAHVLVSEALSLTHTDLADAALMIERCCDESRTFESALHGVTRILKTELGVLGTVVYRVVVADATHASVSELIDGQAGFRSVERRVHLQRSPLGQAIARQCLAGEPPSVVVPVCAAGGVVAAIELTGMDIGVEAGALAALLALAQERLSRVAEPAAKARCRPACAGSQGRVGENDRSENYRTNPWRSDR